MSVKSWVPRGPRAFAVAACAGLVLAATIVAQGGIQPKGKGIGHVQLATQAQRIKKLTKLDVDIPVLKRADFDFHFGDNPDVPRSSAAIRALSKKLFGKGPKPGLDECVEYEMGTLMAALSNPDVSDADRDAVDGDADGAMPAFNKTYTSGHFKFYYTDNNADPKQNCTLANIQATATVLNNAWNSYVANFKTPKSYLSGTTLMINVKCYDLGDSLYGVTNSAWNHMELNSNKVIKDANKRQTTPVHELFHRVQYAYGYITGTANMKWAVEATASWSQKFRAPTIGDWMQRINSGLSSPDQSLTSRSYDVCGMWCYLGQRAGSEKNFVKNCWSMYAPLGGNMMLSVNTNVKSMIGATLSFDHVANWWNFTNFNKDMANASAGFDYAEDELVTAAGYGPLGTVPRTTKALAKGGTQATAGSVSKYGADYHVFTLGAGITKVEVKITTATGKFGYGFIKYKGSTQSGHSRTPAGNVGNYTYSENISLANCDRIAVVVMGIPTGGSYTVTAKGL